MRRLLGLIGAATLVSASCTPTPGSPPLDIRQEAELTVRAMAEACRELCTAKPLYVREQPLGIATAFGKEEPMPAVIMRAISDSYPAAVFIDFDAESRLSDDLLSGKAVLIHVSQVTQLKPDVLGVEVGTTFESFLGQTVQFLWNGSNWVIADSDDTGVTVTTSVS